MQSPLPKGSGLIFSKLDLEIIEDADSILSRTCNHGTKNEHKIFNISLCDSCIKLSLKVYNPDYNLKN